MIDNNNIITTVLGKESCLQRRRLRGATTSDANVGTNTALMGLAGIWGHSARGVVFVAESSRHVVRAYHIANGTTNVVAGIDQFPDFSGDDGPASLAALNNPVFLCGSEDGPDGTLYISDRDNHAIRQVDLSTMRITTGVGQGGVAGVLGDGEPGTAAELRTPAGIAVNAKGDLYIVDAGNYKVRRATKNGVVLQAPFAYEAIRSLYTRIDEFDYAAVNTLLHDLTTEAETFVRQGTDAELVVERQVSMRYKGQGWEIPVRLGAGDFDEFAAENLGGVFTKAYEEFFGRAIADLPIEAVSWSVRVASVQQRPAIQQMLSATRVVSATSHRDIYDPVARAQVSAGIVERDTLEPGDALVGATIIVEPQTTTILGSHHQAVLQSDGSLLITRINEGDAA